MLKGRIWQGYCGHYSSIDATTQSAEPNKRYGNPMINIISWHVDRQFSFCAT